MGDAKDHDQDDSYPGQLDQNERAIIAREINKNNLRNDLAIKLGVKNKFREYENEDRTKMLASNKDKVEKMLELWEDAHGKKATIYTMIKALEDTSPLTRRMIEILKQQREKKGSEVKMDLVGVPSGTAVIIQGNNNQIHGDLIASGHIVGDHNE